MKFEQILAAGTLLCVCLQGTHAFTTAAHKKHTSWLAPSFSSSASKRDTRLNLEGGKLGVKVVGVGSATPQTVLTNVDLESVVETSDEWIRTRTGISQRKVLTHPGRDKEEEEEEEKLSDLALSAAKNALEMANVDAEDLDLVIVCTSSPDDLFGDATTISSGLGCSTSTMSMDLTAACSGFLFGIVTGGQFLNNGAAKKALVVGADALSRWVDWEDRNSCILFGDGAGAAVLTAAESDDEIGLLGYAARSNGASHDKLMVPYNGDPNNVPTAPDPTILSKGKYNCISMDGKEVYKFATREVPRVIKEALDSAEMSVDDVDWLLLHQANIRIMETVASRLKIPMEKVITNLSDYGNTSAASIPLALDEAVRSGKVKKGDVIATAGFGAGLSWGSAILRWGA